MWRISRLLWNSFALKVNGSLARLSSPTEDIQHAEGNLSRSLTRNWNNSYSSSRRSNWILFEQFIEIASKRMVEIRGVFNQCEAPKGRSLLPFLSLLIRVPGRSQCHYYFRSNSILMSREVVRSRSAILPYSFRFDGRKLTPCNYRLCDAKFSAEAPTNAAHSLRIITDIEFPITRQQFP